VPDLIITDIYAVIGKVTRHLRICNGALNLLPDAPLGALFSYRKS
jgi:hypothetical protein